MALCNIDDVKILAGIPDTDTSQDARLELLINVVSSQIETYCGRTFALTTYTETYSPSNRQMLILRNFPVVSVSSLTNDGATFVQGTDYIFSPEYANNGMLYREQGWTGTAVSREYLTSDPVSMKRIINIVYAAGYAVIPQDLQYACQLIVLAAYMQARRNNFDGLTSITEGGLSYQWANQSVIAANNNSGFNQLSGGILNKYRRVVVTA